jgi:hypothetical protein
VTATDDDDALYVLTAAMLTPAQFPGVLADDYPAACAQLGLEPAAEGYGLVFGQDGAGARWTVAVSDTALVACALAAWDCGLEYDLSPDDRYVVAALPGWPLPVAVTAPGVPAPHDPTEDEGGRPALSPPDTAAWGPAQRRLGADEIALQWRVWREQLGEPTAGQGAGTAEPETGKPDADAESDADTPASASDSASRPGLHQGVRRALDAAEEYVRTPPPVGRIRSAPAGEGARTLRVDGPGWSMVARTDDIAFMLLDEDPGEVLPVGRGAELPGLLEALEKLAVRPD